MERDSKLAADRSRDAILHQAFDEVEQVPPFHSGQAELSEDLLLVSRRDPFNRLKFHNPTFLLTINVPISCSCLSATLGLRMIIGWGANSDFGRGGGQLGPSPSICDGTQG
jgi:hypothetical protein